jgi:3'(2'), 5'-bisphosphate nucleotidase
MDSPFARELQTAIAAIQLSASLSQTVLSAEDKGVIEKDDLSPVTVADFAIQALLTCTIHKAFPHDAFVGEEQAGELRSNPVLLERVWGLLQRADSGYADVHCSVPATREEMCDMIDWSGLGAPGRGATDRVWVFDPIDGTKAFIRGEMYAINVALLVGDKQVLGVVGCPRLSMHAEGPVTDRTLDPAGLGCVLFAVKGHGTYIRHLFSSANNAGLKKIEPHAEATTPESLKTMTCFAMLESGIDDVHKEVSERLGIAFPYCDLLGWVPRWAVLAMGLANMTVWVYKSRTRAAKIWDRKCESSSSVLLNSSWCRFLRFSPIG